MNSARSIEVLVSFWQTALDLGKASRDGFWQETGDVPTAENDGGWSESAWSCQWKELRDAGATDGDYDDCLASWQCGFWDRDTSR
jgi:hypothetical protein